MKTKYDKAIAKVVKTMRQRAGYTQAEMGGKLGVSYQQVQKYENGQSRLSHSRVLQYLDILHLDLTTLERMVANEMDCGL